MLRSSLTIERQAAKTVFRQHHIFNRINVVIFRQRNIGVKIGKDISAKIPTDTGGSKEQARNPPGDNDTSGDGCLQERVEVNPMAECVFSVVCLYSNAIRKDEILRIPRNLHGILVFLPELLIIGN